MSRFWWLLKRALVIVYEENCLSVAKGAAYSGLLALFPTLTALAAVLVQIKARAVLGVISTYLQQILPPGTEEIVLTQFAIRGSRPTSLLVLAVVLALYAASGFMISLIEGFNNVYRVPAGRPWLQNRGVAALLVVSAALPFVGASALILFGTRTEESVLRWLQGVQASEPLAAGLLWGAQVARVVIAFCSVVLVSGLLYFLGPAVRLRWRDVWPGALVGSGLWWGLTYAFGWYVRNIAGYNVMYGGLGAVIALLGWIYLISLTTCIGCAFNAARQRYPATSGT
jgi:membrane protein